MKEPPIPVIDMQSAKQRIERKKYNALVLDSFDRISHESKRDSLERRAEVERAAKDRV